MVVGAEGQVNGKSASLERTQGIDGKARDASGPRVLVGGGHHALKSFLCHFITRKADGCDGPVSVTIDHGERPALLHTAKSLLSDLQLKPAQISVMSFFVISNLDVDELFGCRAFGPAAADVNRHKSIFGA